MKSELKTILYCRVAHTDDEAIASQERRLRDYANEHGYKNISVYADNGFNGIDFNRPAFSQMVNDIQAGIVGTIVVANISRISRNMSVYAWLNQIRQAGILFISVADGIDSSQTNNIYDEALRLFEAHIAIAK